MMEVLYGRHAVLETLRAGRRQVRRVQLAEGIQQTGIIADIVQVAKQRGCPVSSVPKRILERVGAVNHQGVIAEAAPYPYVDLAEMLANAESEPPLILVLDHLQDVQNLGTLLRTAEAMAVTGIVLPARRAAGVTPAVVNASAGAVEHLHIAQIGSISQALTTLKAAGIWVAGLDSGPGTIPLGRSDLAGPLALVVGAEGPGLARLVRERCDWLVTIPMSGQVASLNAAVAGSVVLVAARQARSAG